MPMTMHDRFSQLVQTEVIQGELNLEVLENAQSLDFDSLDLLQKEVFADETTLAQAARDFCSKQSKDISWMCEKDKERFG